jgi:hypothetical protein
LEHKSRAGSYVLPALIAEAGGHLTRSFLEVPPLAFPATVEAVDERAKLR